MMNRPIEGVVIAAQLRRRLFGHSFWRDVTLRCADGTEARFARVATAGRLDAALTVGSRGRFHFHDLIGMRGLHGFTPVGGRETMQSFPRLIEALCATLALLNLCVAAAWLAWGGTLSPIALTAGVIATMIWATCYGARQAIVQDVCFEERVAADRRRRAAVLHGHS
jgi:hypothetical protein